MLRLIFEYINLYLLCKILAKLDVKQIWLTTWHFFYVLESDHKTDPSEKYLFCGLTCRTNKNVTHNGVKLILGPFSCKIYNKQRQQTQN